MGSEVESEGLGALKDCGGDGSCVSGGAWHRGAPGVCYSYLEVRTVSVCDL